VKLGIRDLDGWYAFTGNELVPYGVGSLLVMYNRSLSKLLTAIYPNHPWDISKFSKRPQNYWSSLENQRRFMDELGKKLGINSEADFEKWYSQSVEVLAQQSGGGLSNIYKKNFPKLLATVYPNFNWKLWKFPGRIGKVVQSDEDLRGLLDNLEVALGIRQPEDWYRVTSEQLIEMKVPQLHKSNPGGLVALLAKRYPNVDWDAAAFFGRGSRRANVARKGQ